MELLNATKMVAAYTMGMGPDAREHLVVAVKGTFTIPTDGSEPRLADAQLPLVMADEFTGEPGFSATRYESEFPLRKPRCDVLLNGSAYAPEGKLVDRVTVALRVGSMTKSFDVVGDRTWAGGILGSKASKPQPFEKMPITYDRAFGGGDPDPKKPEQTKAYLKNPVGVGYHPFSTQATLEGRPLPNTEETDKPFKSVTGTYRPMSFGPIGRNFEPRYKYAGTYDQQWLDEVFPFLPPDFDDRYHQAAPEDQQIDYPAGGEEVVLVNLTPELHTSFRLPAVEVPVEFTDADFERTEEKARIDTVTIEPDERRFSVVWRVSTPLKRSLFEIGQVVAGRMPKGWYKARATWRKYYPSLGHMAAARGESEE